MARAARRCAAPTPRPWRGSAPARRWPLTRPAGRSGGAKCRLWDFVGDGVTVFRIFDGRGWDQAVQVLGADFAGVLERDGWAAYRRFVKAAHQTCYAHYAEPAVMRNGTGSACVVAGHEGGISVRVRIIAGVRGRRVGRRGPVSGLGSCSHTMPTALQPGHSLASDRPPSPRGGGFDQGLSVAIMRTGSTSPNRLSRYNACRHRPTPHNRTLRIMGVMWNSA
ncbi:MAG: IS66 family transposase [Egibacteraceae bacterium]